jgi:phage/plasmid-like protein (TIGR03299 family)
MSSYLAYNLNSNSEKYFSLGNTQYIKNPEDLNRALQDHGLDYQVDSVQLKHPITGEPIPFFATVRGDTGKVLGAGLTKRYLPIQNTDGFSLIADLAQQNKDGAVFVRGMTFDEGRVAVAQIDLGEMVIGDIGRNGFKDTVSRRITWTNSHDGTGAAHVFTTPIRIVCANTLTAAIFTSHDKISIRHTIGAGSRMEQAASLLKILDNQLTKTEKTYNAMAATKVNKDSFSHILNKLWPSSEKEGRALQNSTQVKAHVSHHFQNADDGKIERDTAWNLYNAITRYNDHDSTVRVDSNIRSYSAKRDARIDSRQESTLVGSIAEKNKLAMEMIYKELDLESVIKKTESIFKTAETETRKQFANSPENSIDLILSMVGV